MWGNILLKKNIGDSFENELLYFQKKRKCKIGKCKIVTLDCLIDLFGLSIDMCNISQFLPGRPHPSDSETGPGTDCRGGPNPGKLAAVLLREY